MSVSKDKGTKAETAVVRWLRDNGFPDAERQPLRGNRDQGDIHARDVIWEVKAGEKAWTAGDKLIFDWLMETQHERDNAGEAVGVLVVARKQHHPSSWWGITTLLDLGPLCPLVDGDGNPIPDIVPVVFCSRVFPIRMLLYDLVYVLRRNGVGQPWQDD